MNAVVYTSNSGFTAQYAGMLGEKLSLPVYPLAEARRALPRGAEIIYLGWLMAGTIKGYRRASSLFRIAAVCGVGMGAKGTQLEEARKANRIPEDIPLFTLQGGFDITKLRGIYKLMMSAMRATAGKMLEKKENRTAEETDMLDLMQNGGSRVCEAQLDELLSALSLKRA